MEEKAFTDDIINISMEKGKPYNAENDVAFAQLQKLLLTALRRYWVPRFLIHVIKITSKDILVLLKRESPGDFGLLTLAKRRRHRMTIRKIYSTPTSCASTPTPTPHVRSTATTPRPKSTTITESEVSLPAPEPGRESRVRFPDELDGQTEKMEGEVAAEVSVSKQVDVEGEGGDTDDEMDRESNIQPADLLALWGGKVCTM